MGAQGEKMDMSVIYGVRNDFRKENTTCSTVYYIMLLEFMAIDMFGKRPVKFSITHNSLSQSETQMYDGQPA